MSQLFKNFGKEKNSGHSQLKASVQRSIRGARWCANSLAYQGSPGFWCRRRLSSQMQSRHPQLSLPSLLGRKLEPHSIYACTTRTPLSFASPCAAKIVEQYPYLADTGVIDVILPKKQDLTLIKL